MSEECKKETCGCESTDESVESCGCDSAEGCCEDKNSTEEKVEKSEVELLKEENQSLKESMLRDRAELENFKRRMNDERVKERKYAQQYVLKGLIDVIDNVERALGVENYESIDALKDGVKMIQTQLLTVVESEGLTEIEALGKAFDPNIHQAVMMESSDDIEDNHVLEVFQKGYMYKDRVLRASMVKVNQK